LETRAALALLRHQHKRENEREGVLVDSFLPSSLRLAEPSFLNLKADMLDIKGVPLRQTLSSLPHSGAYGIYRLPERGPTLFYFMPTADSPQVVLAAASIQALEDEARNAQEGLVRLLDERLRDFSLYRGGFIALFDRQGELLAGRGEAGRADWDALKHFLERAARPGGSPAEAVLRMRREGREEEYLAAMTFSRPFQWFGVIAAPLDEISAPSHGLLRRLAGQSLGLSLAVTLLSLLLLQRVLRPLRLLLPQIKALPDQDFSAPQADSLLIRGLPLNRRDEVGDLARSFAAMGERLHHNIRALMESSALQARLLGEVSAAREIQRGILPPPELSPRIAGLSSAAMLEPAREVGGDLYYFFTLPDGRFAFAIGDVSGKGVPAALFMAITVTLVRYALAEHKDPGAALERINSMLEAHNPQTMFVTLFLALYDPASGRLDYANAGHNPPLLVCGGETRRLDELSGPVAGVMPGLEYQGFSRTLRAGELCLLYTDGITEAVNPAGEQYGEDRLEAWLRARSGQSPKEAVDGLFEDVKAFRGEAAPFDDITMLAFAREG
ncbi:MAG: SpoIIE family protein phosphatase, partial [Deltaproteobacteria bacterium]|nr:SpoIIE family protein phosphatase [Deltaproteobacteria bacterium]